MQERNYTNTTKGREQPYQTGSMMCCLDAVAKGQFKFSDAEHGAQKHIGRHHRQAGYMQWAGAIDFERF